MQLSDMEQEQFENLISKIDFGKGVRQPLTESEAKYGLLSVAWGNDLQLFLYKTGRFYHWEIGKGDISFLSSSSKYLDEKMLQNIQRYVRDIESGRYSNKKTCRDMVAEIVEKRNLTSYMNNTKWKEFRDAMEQEMPFCPPYIYKTLFEEEKGEYFTHFSQDVDVDYLGAYDAESFAGFNYKIIEWVKVRPRYYETEGGRLVQRKILHSAEEEFKGILEKYNIPYEMENGAYVIYGYK